MRNNTGDTKQNYILYSHTRTQINFICFLYTPIIPKKFNAIDVY